MEDPKNIGEHLVDHFSKIDNAPDKKNLIVEAWKESSPENEQEYNQLRKIWAGVTRLAHARSFRAEKAWDNVNQKILSSKVRKQRIRNLVYAVSGMAAALILVFTLNFYTSLLSNSQEPILISTDYGSRSEVNLPDGTVVRLNAGSELRYRYDQIKKSREVEFSGEGFFHVTRNGVPFVITTPENLKIKVLGTKFNLTNYPEDENCQTTLIEGRVELITANNQKLFLEPGQIANFEKSSEKLSYTSGESSHMISWMNNKLYMDNMSLKDVCSRLERWYDVQIGIKNKDLAESIHYTGVLSEETINDVLDALCELNPIQYEMKGKKIIITKK